MLLLPIHAVLAASAARAALALHTTLYSQSDEANLFRTSSGSSNIAAEAESHIIPTDDVIAVQTDKAASPAVVDLHQSSTGEQHRRQKEQSLWLSGKSRQALTNFNDVQYTGFIQVGDQTLSGILDTGSFDLVVFSAVCDSCGTAGRYNPASSKHHRQGNLTSSHGYGSGTVTTQFASDMVSVGPYAPRSQSFWEVLDANMPVLAHSEFQCIIGLGPPETPAVDSELRLKMVLDGESKFTEQGMPVPSELLKAEENLRAVELAMEKKSMMVETFDTTMFSLCFGKQPNSNGYMIWGDTAPLVKPEYFLRMKVVGNHTWSVTLDEPTFVYDPTVKDKVFDRDNTLEGKVLGCEGGCGALLDSGTSLMALPGSVINELVHLTLQPGFNCSNMWELPSIKAKLGGQEIILPPDAYVSEVQESSILPSYLQSFVRMRHLQDLGPARDLGSQELGPYRGSEQLGPPRSIEDLGGRRGMNSQRPGGRCDLTVMESRASTAHGPLWILGLPFFRQYYTTFEITGRSNQNRAIHIAKASDTCHPAPPDESSKFPPRTQLYKRLIDPAKLWVPPSTYGALSSDYVFL
jgi:hypothetical protein